MSSNKQGQTSPGQASVVAAGGAAVARNQWIWAPPMQRHSRRVHSCSLAPAGQCITRGHARLPELCSSRLAGLSQLQRFCHSFRAAGRAPRSSRAPVSHPGDAGAAGSGAGAPGGAVTSTGPAERHQPPSFQVRRCGKAPGCPNAVHELDLRQEL